MRPRYLKCLRINDKLQPPKEDDIIRFPVKIELVSKWLPFCQSLSNGLREPFELMLIDFNFKDDQTGPGYPSPWMPDPKDYNPAFLEDPDLEQLRWADTLVGPHWVGPNSGMLIALHLISIDQYADLPCGVGFHTHHPWMVVRDMTSAMIATQILLATGVPLPTTNLAAMMGAAVRLIKEQAEKTEFVMLPEAARRFRREFLRRAGAEGNVTGHVRLWMEPSSLRELLEIFESVRDEAELSSALDRVGLQFYDRRGKLDCLDLRSVFLDLLYRNDARGYLGVFKDLTLDDVKPATDGKEAGAVWTFIERLASRSPSNIDPVLRFFRENDDADEPEISFNKAIRRPEHRLIALIFAWLYLYGERWVKSSGQSWDPMQDDFIGDFPPLTTQISEFVKIVDSLVEEIRAYEPSTQFVPLFSSTERSIAQAVAVRCEAGSLLAGPLRYGYSDPAEFRDKRQTALKLMADIAVRWGMLLEEVDAAGKGTGRYQVNRRHVPSRRPLKTLQKDVADILGLSDYNELNRIFEKTPGFESHDLGSFLSFLEERPLPEYLRQVALEFVDEFWGPGGGRNIPDSAWPLCLHDPDALRAGSAFAPDRYKAALKAGAKMQDRIVKPYFADSADGFDVWCTRRPAEGVGGDYYRITRKRAGGFRIYLGDVCGRGWPAALVAQEIHGLIMALESRDLDPAALNAELSRKLLDTEDPEDKISADYSYDRWATFICADLHPSPRMLRYSSAGHCKPLIVRANGDHEWLDPQSGALGMPWNGAFRSDEVGLGSGDVVVMFTDGIVECAGDLFTESDLVETAVSYRAKGAKEIGSAIMAQLDRTQAKLDDDLTLIVISVA